MLILKRMQIFSSLKLPIILKIMTSYETLFNDGSVESLCERQTKRKSLICNQRNAKTEKFQRKFEKLLRAIKNCSFFALNLNVISMFCVYVCP